MCTAGLYDTSKLGRIRNHNGNKKIVKVKIIIIKPQGTGLYALPICTLQGAAFGLGYSV